MGKRSRLLKKLPKRKLKNSCNTQILEKRVAVAARFYYTEHCTFTTDNIQNEQRTSYRQQGRRA